MSVQIFREQIDLTEAQVDMDNRALRGVVLIAAGESGNGRVYKEDVLQSAAQFFEGSKAYADHAEKGSHQGIRAITGWYTNVRYEEGKLIADRHFTRTQAGNDVWALAQDIAEGRAPKTLAGLSINAVGTGRKDRDSGKLYVESITGVNSVDDVSNPAAGGAYKESDQSDNLLRAVMDAMTFEEWFESKPDFTKRLQNELKQPRQTKAVKAAQAEADRLRVAFTEAQAALETVNESYAAALSELDSVRRELAIERVLQRVKLPHEWRNDLKEQLVNADVDEWDRIIEREIKKASRVAPQKVTVTGASQQVSESIDFSVPTKNDNKPRDDEDALAYLKRLRGE